MPRRWTQITVLVLILYALSNVFFVLNSGTNPIFGLFGIAFLILAVVVWRETEWGAILVVAAGVAMVLAEFVSAALYLFPEFGPQSEQYFAFLPFLIIVAVGYLNHRDIKSQDRRTDG